MTGPGGDTSSEAGEHLLTLHASAVRFANHGVLIAGSSGDGKSTLALNLMGLGAELIADDYCILSRVEDEVWIQKPDTLPSAIEVRGIGLLHTAMAPKTILSLVVDLTEPETGRIPPPHHCDFFDLRFRKFKRIDGPHFPYAILHYLKHGLMA
ncbi:MAG: serine kinase [Litoreibacter sp.]|nr:serine kinase [Litoreibacter sp.]